MKYRAAFFVLCWLALEASASAQTSQRIIGRTIYHSDESRTESVSDPTTREMTETTYNASNVLTVKKVFLLNEKSEPLQGNVYDGRGNLVARCQCLYDELGRRKEDRLMNVNGEVFQQVIHEYGSDGKAKTPKVINLNASAAPSIRPQSIDFTQSGGAADAGSRFAPLKSGEISPPQSTAAAAAVAPAEEMKPKTNFFKRLFKGKEKK
jgi:hypothetical protein